MKSTLCALMASLCMLLSVSGFAQEKDEADTGKFRNHDMLSISNRGIRIEHTYKGEKGRMIAERDSLREEKKRFSSSFAMFDLGFNMIQDNTDYTNPGLGSYLNIPAANRSKDLFALRTGKSVNVNIYPWMVKFKAVKTPGQRMYIATGVGLQIYNFRYDQPITYTKQPNTIFMDNITFKKNKLALTYLNVPLMVTFKTRIHKDYKGRAKHDEWLVYGVGITEGFLLNSITKQESSIRGKVKLHDQFGLADLNTCLTAEIGVEGILRLFASYQVTSMYGSGAGLDQHPVSIGFRFGGI